MKRFQIDYKGWRIEPTDYPSGSIKYKAYSMHPDHYGAKELYGTTQEEIKRKISMHWHNWGW